MRPMPVASLAAAEEQMPEGSRWPWVEIGGRLVFQRPPGLPLITAPRRGSICARCERPFEGASQVVLEQFGEGWSWVHDDCRPVRAFDSTDYARASTGAAPFVREGEPWPFGTWLRAGSVLAGRSTPDVRR